MKDLFGQEYTELDLVSVSKTILGKRLEKYNYRKSTSKDGINYGRR